MTELKHRIVATSGAQLHIVEAGSGPLVVMLHGFPESWYSWRNQIGPLADAGFHVIAPDLRGYNESSKPQHVDAYRIPVIVQDIVELIEQHGGSCILVGHDWGGIAAWFRAMTRPALVSRLVVMNAPHPVPFSRELRRSANQKLRASYQLVFATPLIGDLAARLMLFSMRFAGRFTREELAVMRAMWRKPGAVHAMVNYYRAMNRHRPELRPLVRPIDIRTMLVWGEKDPVFIRETSENFSDYVPNLRTERIADAGHFVQTDAAERVTALLLDFLR
jgi:pimeloyl-ACP methyl ester carboxylesterase